MRRGGRRRGAPVTGAILCAAGLASILAAVAATLSLTGIIPLDEEARGPMLLGFASGPILILIGIAMWALGTGSGDGPSPF